MMEKSKFLKICAFITTIGGAAAVLGLNDIRPVWAFELLEPTNQTIDFRIEYYRKDITNLNKQRRSVLREMDSYKNNNQEVPQYLDEELIDIDEAISEANDKKTYLQYQKESLFK